MKNLIILQLPDEQIKALKPLLDELKEGWDGISATGSIILQPKTVGQKFTGKLYGQFIPDRYARIIYEVIKAYHEEEE